jgi:hypothetical protein
MTETKQRRLFGALRKVSKTSVLYCVEYLATSGVYHRLNFATEAEARACTQYPRNARRRYYLIETLTVQKPLAPDSPVCR